MAKNFSSLFIAFTKFTFALTDEGVKNRMLYLFIGQMMRGTDHHPNLLQETTEIILRNVDNDRYEHIRKSKGQNF